MRTHTGKDVHAGTRVGGVSKEEMVLRCFLSLVASLQMARKFADMKLYIIDDHSTERCVAWLQKIAESSQIPFEFVALHDSGNCASLKKTYELAKQTARGLIYFVEDDYLHFPEAITEMLHAYHEFREKSGGDEIALYPVDEPIVNYEQPEIEECMLVLGPGRHWRSNTWTTGVHMVSRDVFVKNLELYNLFSNYDTDMQKYNEEMTINKIWGEGGARLFTPIPTLAFHMHTERHISPYLDWQPRWTSCALRPGLNTDGEKRGVIYRGKASSEV